MIRVRFCDCHLDLRADPSAHTATTHVPSRSPGNCPEAVCTWNEKPHYGIESTAPSSDTDLKAIPSRPSTFEVSDETGAQ